MKAEKLCVGHDVFRSNISIDCFQLDDNIELADNTWIGAKYVIFLGVGIVRGTMIAAGSVVHYGAGSFILWLLATR